MSATKVELQILCTACQRVRHSPELQICSGCYEAVTAAANLKEAAELANRVALGERISVPARPGAVPLDSDELTLK